MWGKHGRRDREGIGGNSKGMDLVKILHATIKFQIIKNCKREKHDLDFLKKKYLLVWSQCLRRVNPPRPSRQKTTTKQKNPNQINK